MRTVVVVPMKDGALSKTRLADAMPPADRERMSVALFQRALDFFSGQYPQFERLVVTFSPHIAALAVSSGSSVLMEDGPLGLNPAAQLSLDWARMAGMERILVVPADIPVWLRSEVDDLLDEGSRNPVVIARAHDGGTNALLIDIARSDKFDFCYGPDSARRHAESAQAAALGVTTRTWPFLSHDIDTIDDCLIFSQKLAALIHAG